MFSGWGRGASPNDSGDRNAAGSSSAGASSASSAGPPDGRGGSRPSGRGGDSGLPFDRTVQQPPAAKRPNSKNQQGAELSVDVSGFDPTALERGVVALKSINEAPNAKQVLELSMAQEVTKQREMEARLHEARMQASRSETEGYAKRQEAEQRSRQHNAQLKAEQEKHMSELRKREAEHADRLQRETNEKWLADQQKQFAQQQQMQMETARRVEEERRKTQELEARLKQQTESARTKAEYDGKLRLERENKDVHKELAADAASSARETALALRKETLGHVTRWGKGIGEALLNPEKSLVLMGSLTALAVGVYSAKNGTRVMANYLERVLGKPPLVRETSRRNWLQLPSPSRWRHLRERRDGDVLDKIVLAPDTQARLRKLAEATRYKSQHQAVFQNVLAYGPPGTGKTLFARQLAEWSGMDYAVVAGGDFAPLGADAVTELHKVFDWAEKSKNGVILFVDEADAFLKRGRSGTQSAGDSTMNEDLQHAISAFLARTGTPSRKFQVVLASNVPEALDKAVLDRLDDTVRFHLPGRDERVAILKMYVDQWLLAPQPGFPNGVPAEKGLKAKMDAILAEIAEQTDGWSGRRLSKFVLSIQASVMGKKHVKLTEAVIREVLEEKRQDQADLESNPSLNAVLSP